MAKKTEKKSKNSKKKSSSGASPKGKEVEKIAVKLAKEGKSPAKIGIILRDTYGIGDVKEETGKKLTKILEEKDIKPELPVDLQDLIDRATTIRNHLDEHPKDKEAKYGLQNIESNLRKLAKYYKKKGRIPDDWRY
ncbi:MAG: 30S ribosomal protein S15 [Candidatus Undinarchaeales archaeon]